MRNSRSTKTTGAALLILSATGQPADAVNAVRLDGGSRAPVLLHRRVPTLHHFLTAGCWCAGKTSPHRTGLQPSA